MFSEYVNFHLAFSLKSLRSGRTKKRMLLLSPFNTILVVVRFSYQNVNLLLTSRGSHYTLFLRSKLDKVASLEVLITSTLS
jgi:hypothetical protein